MNLFITGSVVTEAVLYVQGVGVSDWQLTARV